MRKWVCLPVVGLLFLLLSAIAFWSATAEAAGEVNLYSYRQPFLIKPLLDEFTRRTGIRVNAVFVDKGVAEKIKATPGAADAVLTEDFGRLHDLEAAGLLAPVRSKALEANIPPSYRHPEGLWWGLTVRARVIWASKDRVQPGEIASYEDLANPKWKGRICTRSGKHVYNLLLLSSIIAHKGEAGARKWLEGVKANLARKPQGNDRVQAKAIAAGQCDVALANTYYVGKMLTEEKNPEQKQWAAAIRVVFPNQADRGAHVNVSGAAVVRGARNQESAVQLIEFLSGGDAQKIYADENFEYPVKPGVPLNALLQSWGEYKADGIHLAKLAQHQTAASRLMDQVDFDNPGAGN
ncbi:MAG: extracellular solute-binding protein [Nitrospinota bacterium]|mgnify:CR=1 FL=1